MVKPIALPFRARSADTWLGHASTRWQRWLACCCLGACVAGLAAVGWRALQAQQALADAHAQALAQQQRSAAAARALAKPKPVVAMPMLAPARLRALNAVVDRLNQPWWLVLDALEAETTAPISLLSLAADADRGSVRIDAQGPALTPLLAYAQRLRERREFSQVLLLRHETLERERGLPIRLSLDLVLAPPPGAPLASSPNQERR